MGGSGRVPVGRWGAAPRTQRGAPGRGSAGGLRSGRCPGAWCPRHGCAQDLSHCPPTARSPGRNHTSNPGRQLVDVPTGGLASPPARGREASSCPEARWGLTPGRQGELANATVRSVRRPSPATRLFLDHLRADAALQTGGPRPCPRPSGSCRLKGHTSGPLQTRPPSPLNPSPAGRAPTSRRRDGVGDKGRSLLPREKGNEVRRKVKFSLPSPCAARRGVTIVTDAWKPGAGRGRGTADAGPGSGAGAVHTACSAAFGGGVTLFLPRSPGGEAEMKTTV